MNLLITGGAGYIGSHMVRFLSNKIDVDITVLDTLEHGYKEALPKNINLIIGNTGDSQLLDKIFSEKKYDAVIHFAAYIFVEESVKDPVKYFKNNLIGPLNLLDSMEKSGVNKIIFSSTAAVYGYPVQVPIPEDHRKLPESPYGLSKLNFEHLLAIYDKRNVIRSIALRYFNASGASDDGNYGENHKPETHMIPLSINTALGRKDSFNLYGTDYKTRDGTCERDYIHLNDLINAHFLALDALLNGSKSDVYNIGTGRGVTNKEVISSVEKLTDSKIKVINCEKRPGDPSILVADPSKIIKAYNWKPMNSDIESIIKSAIKWHTLHPNGYSKIC